MELEGSKDYAYENRRIFLTNPDLLKFMFGVQRLPVYIEAVRFQEVFFLPQETIPVHVEPTFLRRSASRSPFEKCSTPRRTRTVFGRIGRRPQRSKYESRRRKRVPRIDSRMGTSPFASNLQMVRARASTTSSRQPRRCVAFEASLEDDSNALQPKDSARFYGSPERSTVVLLAHA